MAEFNHRRFLVSNCPGLIGQAMPIAYAPAGEAVRTGIVVSSESGKHTCWMTGAVGDSAVQQDVFGDFSRMSGRLRGSIWLTKRLEKRLGRKLPVGSLGPQWLNGSQPGDPRWVLRDVGWEVHFTGRKVFPGEKEIRIEGLLDLERYPDHCLPDGTAEVDAIALKLVCETMGVDNG